MTQEALKLALDALEQISAYRPLTFAECSDAEAVMGIAEKAITAIKEALRENAMREVQRLGQEIEQEPVAWVSEDVCKGQYIDGKARKIWWECEKGVGTAFYTTPPQRTWVGLTEDEQDELVYSVYDLRTRMELAIGIEAKLKEKNT